MWYLLQKFQLYYGLAKVCETKKVDIARRFLFILPCKFTEKSWLSWNVSLDWSYININWSLLRKFFYHREKIKFVHNNRFISHLSVNNINSPYNYTYTVHIHTLVRILPPTQKILIKKTGNVYNLRLFQTISYTRNRNSHSNNLLPYICIIKILPRKPAFNFCTASNNKYLNEPLNHRNQSFQLIIIRSC